MSVRRIGELPRGRVAGGGGTAQDRHVTPTALAPLSAPPRTIRWAAALAILLLSAALLATGCRSERDTTQTVRRERVEAGDPRGFQIGFTDTPAALTQEAYRAVFDTAGDYGEVIVVQRTVAWGEFVPGGRGGDGIREQALSAGHAASDRGLTLVVALDPFDPGARGRLNALPSKYRGKSLADEDLRRALVQDAVFTARTMHPAYLAIGIEVNTTYERNPEEYAAFVSAYREAYDAVKQAAPETRVFPGFQYEELLGIVPDLPAHPPRWQLLEAYRGKIDLFAITTYPSFVYEVARKIPPRYYVDALTESKLPVAFLSAGFASAPGRDGMNSATAPEQRRYLQRLLDDAALIGAPFVAWYAPRDPGFAQQPPFDLLRSLGLRDEQNRPKEAWELWEQTSNRPLQPALAEEARRAVLGAGGGSPGEPGRSP